MSEENNSAAEEQKVEKTSNNLDLNSIFAVKAGMTRFFDENGNHVPVTVVELIPNKVAQVKTPETDGYSAYQVAYYAKREKLINNPTKGHLKKAKIKESFKKFAEVKVDETDTAYLGKEVGLGAFSDDMFIDITGVTKGKGFQGVIKRHNFQGGPAAHGSKFNRSTGSIGNRATPGRVFKIKKMPGHMGVKKQTVQNLKIVKIEAEKGYMLVKGSVPGPTNGFIRISKARKK